MQRQTYQNLKSDQTQFQSLTGYSLRYFDLLYPYFEVQWNQYHSHFTIAGQVRRRPLRHYRNRVFEDTQSSLVFIMYYLKNNPLQQAQAAMFGMSQPQANFWIHLLKDILLKALKSAKSLPCRDFDSLQKLLEEGQDVLLDGSERPIPRPADQEVQKEYYSGKKNTYGQKYSHYIHD